MPQPQWEGEIQWEKEKEILRREKIEIKRVTSLRIEKTRGWGEETRDRDD